MAFIIFAGFARSYYLKGVFGTPALPLLLHVHGLVMTTWFVLFFVQVRLVATDRTDIHRRLGVAGAAVAGLVVTVGGGTALKRAHLHFTENPNTTTLRFLPLLFEILLLFAIFVTAAILLRGRPDFHKRLMVLASLSIIQPATDRLPLHFPDSFSSWEFIGLADLCIALCIVADAFRNRRLHPVWIWGSLVVLTTQIVVMAVGNTLAWHRIAVSLVK